MYGKVLIQIKDVNSQSNESVAVSVVMAVYNSEKYLRQSIDSILNQSFINFEFIIIDDGSTDKSLTVIKSYKDKRIRLVTRTNKGLALSLNEGLEMARGKYIARQDADDYSDKERLCKQVDYLEKNIDVALLGTNYNIVFPDGNLWFATNMFTHPSDVKLATVFSNQIGHGTAMFRRKTIEKAGEYDKEQVAEDYDLWTRIARTNKIANLKESLYSWRYYPDSLSTSNQKEINNSLLSIITREFKWFRKHKRQYNLISLHIKSVNGGTLRYLKMKSSLFRNMSLMYCKAGFRRYALASLILALLHAPWNKKSYRYLWVIAFQEKEIPNLEYDVYVS